jgi:adenylyltransferase/sulfurtransferase
MTATATAAAPPREATLSTAEMERYARHLTLPQIGVAGQRRLKQGRVLLIGAGGLGSPAALYLAAAGVGALGLIDHDTVDVSNLQRQVLHGTGSVGRAKVDSARDRIGEINPHVHVETYPERLSAENARALVREYDVVLDGTDNFTTRYLANDACVLEGKPNVHGAIYRFEGQNSVFGAGHGPCYRCLFPEPPAPGSVPSCAEGGVLGVLPGIVGAIQATEAIKLLAGIGEPLVGRLLLFDALRLSFRELTLARDPGCPVCGDHPTIRELVEYDPFCALPTDPEATMPEKKEVPEMSVTELKARLDHGDRLTLIDVREPHEWEIGNLEPQGARLIPLGELPERMDEIDPAEEIVLHCRSGGRSARALELLREHGYRRLWNLEGGILAWSDEIDPSIPKY